MNSKKWIIQYLEVLLDIIVMFTSYLIANWYKFGFFRTIQSTILRFFWWSSWHMW